MVKVLDETPPEQAEWVLFMQPDTVIDDVAFTFPFEFYQVRECAHSAHAAAPIRVAVPTWGLCAGQGLCCAGRRVQAAGWRPHGCVLWCLQLGTWRWASRLSSS